MTTSKSWRPTSDIETLRQRAEITASIRRFFDKRGVLEVETPQLCRASVTDVHLHSFNSEFRNPLSPDTQQLYLQTSPEFAMKRLLCAGSGAIYQINKSFRNEEAGRFHNPEFSMLEWYRPGFDHLQLMNEVDAMLQEVLQCEPAEVISYQQVFLNVLQIDPLAASLDDLKLLCRDHGFEHIADDETDLDTLLQLLFSEKIESVIGQQKPCLVYGFPASQAALARIDEKDPRIARRFEAYYKGIELANGFHELADADEQLQRFEQDNKKRVKMGLPQVNIDQEFISALQHGLPDCAGVALGIDRLMMLALGKNHIREVMAFSVDNA